jgi:hypothetical protein
LSQAAVDTAAAMLMEARGLLLRGWCHGAQARDERGHIVPALSEDASSWSLLGALLAASRDHDLELDEDFDARSAEALALGDAIAALGEATGTASLDEWSDARGRRLADVLAAIDHALGALPA